MPILTPIEISACEKNMVSDTGVFLITFLGNPYPGSLGTGKFKR